MTQQQPQNEAREWIEAVRADSKVGRGTCSVIDECYTDSELLELFCDEEVSTAKQAVKAARAAHKLWNDREQDILNA